MSQRQKRLIKWFLLGFVVRLGLAIIILLLSRSSGEAPMLFLADVPTVWLLDLIDRMTPVSVVLDKFDTHPFYVSSNVLASFLWGFIFMLLAAIIHEVYLYWNFRKQRD